ncbi:hypothetical protein LQ385_30670, partial [Rhodococcus qingshengii]
TSPCAAASWLAACCSALTGGFFALVRWVIEFGADVFPPEVLPEFVFPLFCGFCALVREVIEFGFDVVFEPLGICFEATEVGAFAFFSGGSAKIGYAVASSAYTF